MIKNWKKCTIHDQFSVTSFTVSVKLWHIKSDFSTSFKITIDERFFMKNHLSFWNHPRYEHFHFFLWNWHFGSMKLTNILTFLCETVKTGSLFLWNCERLIFKILGLDTRFYGLFYVKNEVSAVNLIYFIFYCGTVSRENWVKLVILFLFYLAQKNETGWWFHGWKLA